MPLALPDGLQVQDNNLTLAATSAVAFQSDNEQRRRAPFLQEKGSARRSLGAKFIASSNRDGLGRAL